MQVVNDHVVQGVSLPSGALALGAKSIGPSTATETLWIITQVMDNTSAVLSTPIRRDVNLALFLFNIIICIVLYHFLLLLLSGVFFHTVGQVMFHGMLLRYWWQLSLRMIRIIDRPLPSRYIPYNWPADTMLQL